MHILTSHPIQIAKSSNFPFCTIEPHQAKVAVPDPLLRRLAKIANARRVIESQINFVDIAGLVKGIFVCPILN